MRLKNPADRRTVLWTLLAPGVVAVQFAWPATVPWLCAVSCYFALACGIIAHNHNHHPTFKGKRANHVFGAWISIFYGYPTFAWIPTHNLNHHRHVNAADDATRTWRHTNRHNLLVALTYFFVSAYHQSDPIKDFIRTARAKNRPLFRRIVLQYAIWIGAYAALLALAILLHGAKTGIYVWVFAVGLPAFFALWTIMLFNYEQHVHADPFSDTDHSRSFTSPVLNYLLFNNGYHAAHHERPSTHWSRLKDAHRELAPRIHPSLNEPSIAWYWVKQYAIAPIVPRFGTRQIGPGPYVAPPGSRTFDAQALAPEELVS